MWVVVGKMDYEGDYLQQSGKVFLNKEDGIRYGESLVDGSYGKEDQYLYVSKYDGYSIKECEVN